MEEKETTKSRKRKRAKKRPKQQTNIEENTCPENSEEIHEQIEMNPNKSQEQIQADRKAKKAQKQQMKKKEAPESKDAAVEKVDPPVEKPKSTTTPGKPPLSPNKATTASVASKKPEILPKRAPLRKTPSPVQSTRKTPSPVGSPVKTSPATPRKVPSPVKTSPAAIRKVPISPLSSPKKSVTPVLAPKKPVTSPTKVQVVSKPKAEPAPEIAETKIISEEIPLEKSADTEKSREKIKAEREAKKLAKKAGKAKEKVPEASVKPKIEVKETIFKSSELVNAPVEKINSSDEDLAQKLDKIHISTPTEVQNSSESSFKIPIKTELTKAERRAKQEAQRAAKQKALDEKKAASAPPSKKVEAKPAPKTPKATLSKFTAQIDTTHKVKLFKHLYLDKCSLDLNVNGSLHPSIIKLGIKYAKDIIVGSNARCYALLNALKTLINDYETPPQKEFGRSLETQVQSCSVFLQKCRPFAVSMTNALKFLKYHINHLDTSLSDSDNKEILLDAIDTYVRDQIEKAAQAISIAVQQKISNDDVILTYGASSLIKHILEEANRRKVNFRVIVVDSRPDHEGLEMLDSLVAQGIDCTYILINAISFIMPEVTKVMLGAHALMANGYVMSRVGTAQIALVAKSFNVPVLVCCETHKFSERVQTDAFVYNEIGDPDCLIKTNTAAGSIYLKDWKSKNNLTPLNLKYDITPPELVTLVVTEIALLPCTSVPVILRVKPAEVA